MTYVKLLTHAPRLVIDSPPKAGASLSPVGVRRVGSIARDRASRLGRSPHTLYLLQPSTPGSESSAHHRSLEGQTSTRGSHDAAA